MDKKRLLTEEEKILSLKNLKRLQNDWIFKKWEYDHSEMWYSRGLFISYKQQKRKYKDIMRETDKELELIEKNIDVVQDQIDNGVIIKEDNKNE